MHSFILSFLSHVITPYSPQNQSSNSDHAFIHSEHQPSSTSAKPLDAEHLNLFSGNNSPASVTSRPTKAHRPTHTGRADWLHSLSTPRNHFGGISHGQKGGNTPGQYRFTTTDGDRDRQQSQEEKKELYESKRIQAWKDIQRDTLCIDGEYIAGNIAIFTVEVAVGNYILLLTLVIVMHQSIMLINNIS